MAKRTAIIDIGSNSARLVIFQHTSKNGFHLICEQKSRVRIGEGAYNNGGNLQKTGMDRAYNTLRSFSQTINEFKVAKVIAVATSALRDAPNSHLFLDRVTQDLKLEIIVIDGKEEALLGAIAANNLLPITDGITIDIGGGSSDIALIRNGKIKETYSLDLGTVRLKELFFDKNLPLPLVREHIGSILKTLPKPFISDTAIGIGGTARTLAKAIMQKSNYPLNKLHAFEYTVDNHQHFLKSIISSDKEELQSLPIKIHRHDTIREGTLIFLEILHAIGAKQVITSGVGVREGVYLRHRFPNPPHKLPINVNPSIKSIRDRFDILSLPYGNKKKIARALYALFNEKIGSGKDYFPIIEKTLSLSDIGKILTIYHKDRHASYIAMQELNYGFKHEEMALISLLLYTKAKRGYHKALYTQCKLLLPPKQTVKWLAFIYLLTLTLHRASAKAVIQFKYTNNILEIKSDKSLYLAAEEIESIKKPKKLKVVL